jgi:uncharacterized protein (TIGR04551 family)
MTWNLLAALAASLACTQAAQAQSKADKDKEKAPAVQPTDVDRQIQDAVQRELAKAREQLRDEMRAELQGAQSAAAFLGTDQERPKLNLLDLSGYLRFRWDLFKSLSLNRGTDAAGYALFPQPVIDPGAGTQTSANLRFRFDPTINVSEEVRIRGTFDVLDNLVLGSTPQVGPRNDMDFTAWSQLSPSSAIAVKRAWGEVQTPIGLISFGRMPSQWGMGVLANSGNDLDDDHGDNVDRIQFAIPVGTALRLTLIPHYDFLSAGITSESVAGYRGQLGQSIQLDQALGVGAIGVKVVRLDTPEEIRRRLEKGLSSLNGGLYFSYRSQRYASLNDPGGTLQTLKRDASSYVFDLWGRYETRRLKLEAEVVAVYGSVGNGATRFVPKDANDLSKGYDPEELGSVLIRQAGGALRGGLKLAEGKLILGAEVGAASGDRNRGFGNYPTRACSQPPPTPPATELPPYTCFDGRQYAAGDPVVDLRNFRFNPAYRVDLVLWRQIIGGITDAFYVKPGVRWEMLPGVVGTAQVIYSQAFYASSTPSGVDRGLGVEVDLGLSYASDDGFVFFLDYGLLFPLDGMRYRPETVAPPDLDRAHNIHTGLAVKF